jgi:putative serine protease PepD
VTDGSTTGFPDPQWSSGGQRPPTAWPGGAPQPPTPQPPSPPQPSSAWWSSGGGHDPWRNPQTPAVLLHQTNGEPGPPLDPVPDPPAPGAAPRRSVGLAVTIVVALLAGALGGALGYLGASGGGTGHGVLGASATDKPKAADRAPESVSAVVKKALPSVVTILIRTDKVEGNGSGFVISSSGYILTNNHVAAAGSGGELKVAFSDGTTADATVKGTDPESDLAVLKVDKSGLTPIKFGDSDRIAVGDPVIAIGAPYGLSNTVTTGIISDLDRPVITGKDESSEAYMAAIQTDAAINHGNSGGPLLDGAGRVIGVNTAIRTADESGSDENSGGNIGLGFSIPINQAKRVADDIIQTGKARRTVIGATVDSSYDSTAGARINKVVGGGPADKAGLKDGDVIVRYDGQLVGSGTDLIAFVRKDAPGTVVPVEYARDGGKHSANITLGAATPN